MGVDSFSIDRAGFTARCSYDDDTLVFFSVPYDKGWHAQVDGIETRIEKADIGLMAVRVPAGEVEIRFSYLTPGLAEGLLMTGAGLLLLAVYLLIARLAGRRRSAKTPARADLTAALEQIPPLTADAIAKEDAE